MPLTVMAGAATLSAAGWLAAETGSGPDLSDPLSIIQTFGFPTAVVLMFVFGLLRTKGENERLARDLETERAQRIALQTTLINDVMPALTRSTDAVTRSTDLMESMARRQAGGG